MEKSIKKSARLSLCGIVAFINLSILVFIWYGTGNLDEIYKNNVMLDAFYLAMCVSLLIVYAFNRGFDIFDPIFFVSAIYLTMFFVTPIYDISEGNYYWYGYPLFEYGLKSSTIAFFGYIAMYVFYVFGNKNKSKDNSAPANKQFNSLQKKNTLVLPFVYCMYSVAFAANVYYLINSGFGDLTYLLTLGLGGAGNNEATASNIGFVSMLSYSLPTIVLLVCEYSSSRLIKILLFIPMFMLQVARGYRFFIVQIVVTFVAYYYLKRKKRPKLRKILFFLFILLLFVLIMTIFRNAIRTGSGVDFSVVNRETIKDAFDAAFWDNLRIYQNVYGMVGVIPSEYPFVGLRQILIGTLIMTIPRAIWPGKISSYGGEGLRVLIGDNIAPGQAYPTLGEYYYAFGIFGVLFFMAIFGLWLKKLKKRYMDSQNPLDLIYFSVMLGCCLQLIIRGYFPSNFWYLLFAILPIWIVKIMRSEN